MLPNESARLPARAVRLRIGARKNQEGDEVNKGEYLQRWQTRLSRLVAALLALLIVAALGSVWSAHAGYENPPCVPRLPDPPLVVVLPDGTEVPATTVRYDLSSRRIEVVGYTRVFCDGAEGE